MDRYIVKPGKEVQLKDWDADDKSAYDGDKEAALDRIQHLTGKLEQLQEILYAQHRHKILIVLQGMDTSGKDGVVSHVFEGVNPQGVRVASFKAPTPEELDHDYLWRIHRQVPGKGEIVIFNRSHYEDVLIVRVHNLVPQEIWSKRYGQINDFEKMLFEEGTTILKFFLFISSEEQKERLEARLKDPTKIWKFNPEDLNERKLWPEYMQAYQDMVNRTSTDWAPWMVVPANTKWYRNLVVAERIVSTLESLGMSYPKPSFDPKSIQIK